jgi:hypothetical protein
MCEVNRNSRVFHASGPSLKPLGSDPQEAAIDKGSSRGDGEEEDTEREK